MLMMLTVPSADADDARAARAVRKPWVADAPARYLAWSWSVDGVCGSLNP